jgi:hypothetical protein
MKTLQLKKGLIATSDGWANFILKAGNGYMRAYTETLDINNYKQKLRTKRFSELSIGCQSWLLELEKTYTKPHDFAGNEQRKNISAYYYELTGTGIYVYSAFDCGIQVDDIREYLVLEGLIKAESYFEKYNYLANA